MGESIHEDFVRKQEVRGTSDRSFGIVFAGFFLLVGVAPLRVHHPVRWWGPALAGAFLIVAILRPVCLQPMNRAWTKLGLLLGKIMTPIVMSFLFYGVFTPTAFLFRLLGKDLLQLGFDSAAQTYWIERRPPGPKPETMSHEF